MFLHLLYLESKVLKVQMSRQGVEDVRISSTSARRVALEMPRMSMTLLGDLLEAERGEVVQCFFSFKMFRF